MVVISLMGTTYVPWIVDHGLVPISWHAQTAKKKITASSIYFQSLPYAISPETHLIDYPALANQARTFKPRLIICGASAYPRDWDYAELRKIADKEGAWLMADIAHTSGLIAAQELNDPFQYCDVVTTTT
jgi:glycine hydroxymethyltransferase